MFTEKRPVITTEMIIECATQADFDSSQVGDISVEYSEGMDGGELAESLINYGGWEPRAALADDLDEVIESAEDELKKREFDWVVRNNITQPLPNGTRIKEGIIDGTYEYGAARYTVIKNGENESSASRQIIKFEDAVQVNEEGEA